MTFFLLKLMTFPKVLSYANNQEQLAFSFPCGWAITSPSPLHLFFSQLFDGSLSFVFEYYTVESAYTPPLTFPSSITTPQETEA